MPRISPRVFAPARLNLRTIQAPARRTKLEEDSYQHLYFAHVGMSSRINVRVKGGAQGVTPPTLKRGPSTALCRMRVRSGTQQKIFPSASTPWPTIRQLQWGQTGASAWIARSKLSKV